MNTGLSLVTVIMCIAAVLLVGAIRFYRKHRATTIGHSILVDYYSEDAEPIITSQGLVGDMYYSVTVTNRAQSEINGEYSRATLYRVELPFQTKIHLLGIPKKSGAVQLNPTFSRKSNMEKVELEGNFNQYFALYAGKGSQSEARYVLDPVAMVFALDFCQSHNWEIIDSYLYFLQSDNMSSASDPSYMWADILHFVEEVKPALERPAAQLERQLFLRKDAQAHYRCPICDETLENKPDYFTCPRGDGILLTGGKLALVRNGNITAGGVSNQEIRSDHGQLTCPSCHTAMNQVPYSQSSTMIDTCQACPYRWLDAGEAQKIVRIKKPANINNGEAVY